MLTQIHKKKKGGILSDLVNGTAGYVVLLVMVGVVISTILGAGLLTSGSVWDNVTIGAQGNFTAGAENINLKLPTILLVAAVVILFAVLALLVARARAATNFGGGSGSL